MGLCGGVFVVGKCVVQKTPFAIWRHVGPSIDQCGAAAPPCVPPMMTELVRTHMSALTHLLVKCIVACIMTHGHRP